MRRVVWRRVSGRVVMKAAIVDAGGLTDGFGGGVLFATDGVYVRS